MLWPGDGLTAPSPPPSCRGGGSSSCRLCGGCCRHLCLAADFQRGQALRNRGHLLLLRARGLLLLRRLLWLLLLLLLATNSSAPSSARTHWSLGGRRARLLLARTSAVHPSPAGTASSRPAPSSPSHLSFLCRVNSQMGNAGRRDTTLKQSHNSCPGLLSPRVSTSVCSACAKF